MGSKLVATYHPEEAAWKIDLPRNEANEQPTYVPYWVTRRLAHDLGTDFNVLEDGGRLRVTSRLFRGAEGEPHASTLKRHLTTLLDMLGSDPDVPVEVITPTTV